MKVGLLTFHRAHNYGAVLQAYALQTALERMGHDASFVDYEISSMLFMYKWRCGLRSIVNRYFFTLGIKRFFIMLLKKKRYDRFVSFTSQYLKQSNTGLSNLDNEFDVIAIGSDQVLNPGLTGGVNNAYWGVLPTFSKRLIMYAASTRPYELTPKQIVDAKQNLKKFSALSVREPYTADFLRPLTEKDIEVVLDPTLLLSVEEWDIIAAKRQRTSPYMFYYYLDSNDCELDYVRKLAKEKGLKLITIGCFNESYSSLSSFCAGPSEFLSWIKYADYVVTSSFHCTVFSIIFNKQFSVMPISGKKDYRVTHLLDTFGFGDRMIRDKIFNDAIIDKWDFVNTKLKELPLKSLDFLKRNITVED